MNQAVIQGKARRENKISFLMVLVDQTLPDAKHSLVFVADDLEKYDGLS